MVDKANADMLNNQIFSKIYLANALLIAALVLGIMLVIISVAVYFMKRHQLSGPPKRQAPSSQYYTNPACTER